MQLKADEGQANRTRIRNASAWRPTSTLTMTKGSAEPANLIAAGCGPSSCASLSVII